MSEKTKLWQGRINTIEQRVGTMITISQNRIMSQVKQGMKQTKESVNEIKHVKEVINHIQGDIENIKDIMLLLKDNITRKEGGAREECLPSETSPSKFGK